MEEEEEERQKGLVGGWIKGYSNFKRTNGRLGRWCVSNDTEIVHMTTVEASTAKIINSNPSITTRDAKVVVAKGQLWSLMI